MKISETLFLTEEYLPGLMVKAKIKINYQAHAYSVTVYAKGVKASNKRDAEAYKDARKKIYKKADALADKTLNK